MILDKEKKQGQYCVKFMVSYKFTWKVWVMFEYATAL